MSTSALPWEEAGQANPAPWEEAKSAGAKPSTDVIGVNRGPQTYSPGYRYSTGYAGPNDAPRDSGGFIDRMTTQAGRALSDPHNFIPSWESLFPPVTAAREAIKEWDAYRHPEAPHEDPARQLGSMAPAVLTAAVTHASDAMPNLGEAAGSELVPSGVAHPIEGLGRAIKAIPRPDLMTAVRDPLKAAIRPITSTPEVVRAGLGEDIRVHPVPRPAPLWKNAPTEGTPVPSVLEQPRPNAIRPSPRPAPPPPTAAAPEAPPVTTPTPEEAANNARFIQSRQQPGVYREPPNALNDKMTPQEVDAWQESVFNKKPENVDIGAKIRAKNPEPTRAEVRAARTKAPAKTAAPASNWPFSFPPAELNARLAEQMKQIATAEQPLPTLEENPEAPPVQTSRPLFINGKVAAPTEDLTAAMEESLRRTGKTKKPVQ